MRRGGVACAVWDRVGGVIAAGGRRSSCRDRAAGPIEGEALLAKREPPPPSRAASTATAAAPGVVLCIANGIVRIVVHVVAGEDLGGRLRRGIDRLISVAAGEDKRCDNDRDAKPHGRFPTHWSGRVGRSFGRCAGEVGHHALRRRGGDLIEQPTLNFNSLRRHTASHGYTHRTRSRTPRRAALTVMGRGRGGFTGRAGNFVSAPGAIAPEAVVGPTTEPSASTAPLVVELASRGSSFARGSAVLSLDPAGPVASPGTQAAAIIERRLSERPTDIRDAARALSKAIADEIERLNAVRPNDHEPQARHDDFVGFLRQIADGLNRLADTIDRAIAASRLRSSPSMSGRDRPSTTMCGRP
jgi:hypothetical protein